MAKFTVKFLSACVDDDQVESFVKKFEALLKDFAGSAYAFRYDIEETSSPEEYAGLRKKGLNCFGESGDKCRKSSTGN